MLRYGLLMYLWVLTGAHKNNTPRDIFFAPEDIDNRELVVTYDEVQSPYRLRVNLYENWLVEHIQELNCTFYLEARPNTKAMNITSLRRLDRNNAILTWYDEKAYGIDRRTTMELITLRDNCERLAFVNVKGNPILVPFTDTIDVFVDGDDFYRCGTVGMRTTRCRYSLKVSSIPEITEESVFGVDYDWSSIRIERLPSKDFVIRGSGPDKKHHLAKMSHSNSKINEFWTLPRAIEWRSDFSSSGMSFCWIDKPGDVDHLECAQFTDDGKNKNQATYHFERNMMLISINAHDDIIHAVLGYADCINHKDCWTITEATLNQSSETMSVTTRDFSECRGLRKHFTVFWKNSSEFSYKYECISRNPLFPGCLRDGAGRFYCRGNCTRL